ncbi:type II toxin-antitoxin system PemK/MazF family toxin [Rhodohalobacter sp.]|uniref:type II toxin-antitoxin system PemK/MazF family toxin n=1 Tax=Rhodohalobacter sp. TaxID=1974210 RepID=UPI002ACDD5D4|nr:type II toxin-antitoxin system PemK/MazF family toxin [Rhodohalobacter sp.]MDZ7755873.1 type II toxin-antitoxin system PemK/MazF family toxin [Rhodohalobacter sp.]
MERFVKGDVVVVPFPFSDLSRSKRRPALVVQNFEGDDLLLAQITSKLIRDEFAVKLFETDFKSGKLNKQSNIRPNKLFTCSKNLILYKIGNIKEEKMKSITESIKLLLDN